MRKTKSAFLDLLKSSAASSMPLEPWAKRHAAALHSPSTEFERAVRELLFGWARYGDAHGAAYDSDIREDGVLGPHWEDIGIAIQGLLNGELGRFDGGSLDGFIARLLEPKEPHVTDSPSEVDMADSAYISVFSRAEAIEGGILIDVTETAKEEMISIPTAVTLGVWADINDIPSGLQGLSDNPTDRLRDVLAIGGMTLSSLKGRASTCRYPVVMPVKGRTVYEVKAICGLGDELEPVLTLMRRDED